MGNVKSMAEFANDGTRRAPEDALNDALGDVGKGGALKKGRKVLILSLDTTSENYDMNFYQAGMHMSECLALCEVAKTVFLKEMEYIE